MLDVKNTLTLSRRWLTFALVIVVLGAGHVLWVWALDGQSSWDTSPNPSPSASGSSVARTLNWKPPPAKPLNGPLWTSPVPPTYVYPALLRPQSGLPPPP